MVTAVYEDIGGAVDLRQGNLAQILQYLHEHGSSSRREISIGCGLAVSTLTALIGELKTHRLVQELAPVRRAEAGRPTRPIALDGAPWCVVGIHVDGGAVLAAATTVGGEELWQCSRTRGAEDPVGDICGAVSDALDHFGLHRRLVAVHAAVTGGSGVARPVDASRLRAALAAAGLLPSPSLVDVSVPARLAALEAGRQLSVGPKATVAYLGGLTEITSGLVIDGQPFSGATDAAGPIAHTCVSVGGASCDCGQSGCLDSVAGLASLLARGGILDAVAARRLVASTPGEGLSLLLDRAAAADPRVLATLDVAGLAIGQVIDTVIGLVDPHVVVLGDYLGMLHPFMATSVAARVRAPERIQALGEADPARVVRGAVLASQRATLAAPLTLTSPV